MSGTYVRIFSQVMFAKNLKQQFGPFNVNCTLPKYINCCFVYYLLKLFVSFCHLNLSKHEKKKSPASMKFLQSIKLNLLISIIRHLLVNM